MEEEKCFVCGEDATRYDSLRHVLPICDNVVCYVTRLEHIKETIKSLNDKIVPESAEGLD